MAREVYLAARRVGKSAYLSAMLEGREPVEITRVPTMMIVDEASDVTPEMWAMADVRALRDTLRAAGVPPGNDVAMITEAQARGMFHLDDAGWDALARTDHPHCRLYFLEHPNGVRPQ